MSTQEDCRDNLIYITDLSKLDGITGKLELTQLVYEFKSDYNYVTNVGSKFVFQTNCNAPNYQLVSVDLEADDPKESRTWTMQPLVPEHEKNVLEWATCVDKDKLILCYMKDVKNVMDVHDLTSGKFLYNLELDVGSVISFSGKEKHTEILLPVFLNGDSGTDLQGGLHQGNPQA